jgi:hypothetical protein
MPSKPETTADDDATMRMLVSLEALQKLAAEAGNKVLAAQLKATFDETLQRHYDAKRAQLEAAMERAQVFRSSRRA